VGFYRTSTQIRRAIGSPSLTSKSSAMLGQWC